MSEDQIEAWAELTSERIALADRIREDDGADEAGEDDDDA